MGDAEVVGADPHELPVFLVEFEEFVVAIEVFVADDVVEFGEAGEVGAWEAVEGVEEEAVDDEAGVKTGEVDAETVLH